MITVRQLEHFWSNHEYNRMLRLCLEMRPESSLRLSLELSRPAAAAALAIIRLDELAQSHLPFCASLIRFLISNQQPDGGWADPLTTALCLRALACSRGQGPAIDRGLAYLADLQKSEGIWPKLPIRRTPADPFISALILFYLLPDPRFPQTVRATDALHWFATHAPSLDPDTSRLHRTLRLRHPHLTTHNSQPTTNN